MPSYGISAIYRSLGLRVRVCSVRRDVPALWLAVFQTINNAVASAHKDMLCGRCWCEGNVRLIHQCEIYWSLISGVAAPPPRSSKSWCDEAPNFTTLPIASVGIAGWVTMEINVLKSGENVLYASLNNFKIQHNLREQQLPLACLNTISLSNLHTIFPFRPTMSQHLQSISIFLYRSGYNEETFPRYRMSLRADINVDIIIPSRTSLHPFHPLGKRSVWHVPYRLLSVTLRKPL